MGLMVGVGALDTPVWWTSSRTERELRALSPLFRVRHCPLCLIRAEFAGQLGLVIPKLVGPASPAPSGTEAPP